jgi:predicted AlkP superfamily pyrophosphatase or phosphodiesterase
MLRIFLALAFLTCSALAENHVILITIDGFPGRMLTDKRADLPNLRALAADGAFATNGMKVSTPSVTWPNHTTLISGVRPRKHSVLFNGVLMRGGAGGQVRIDPNKTAAELVTVPTIFDLLHDAGMKTAGVNWPCTRLSKSLDDDFPDSPNTLEFTTPRFRSEMVAAGILPGEKPESFNALGQPERDEIWTKAACYLIRKRMPNFMTFHLLNTDSTHHKYGPESMASYTALALADRFIGDVVAAVKDSGHKKNTTIIVTADHGFATATNIIQPNVLLRQAGLMEYDGLNKLVKARVQCVSEGGSGFIYLNDAATREEDRKKVIELFAGKEGVAEVIGADRFAALGIPDAGQGGSPDLLLRPKIGYGVGGAALGDQFIAPVTMTVSAGYHGYIADEPLMNALFVASGRGIKKGAKIGVFENVDIAPTIMHLLGKSFLNGDGKALTEILER